MRWHRLRKSKHSTRSLGGRSVPPAGGTGRFCGKIASVNTGETMNEEPRSDRESVTAATSDCSPATDAGDDAKAARSPAGPVSRQTATNRMATYYCPTCDAKWFGVNFCKTCGCVICGHKENALRWEVEFDVCQRCKRSVCIGCIYDRDDEALCEECIDDDYRQAAGGRY